MDNNNRKHRNKSKIKVGFEPTSPVSEWVCGRAGTVIGPGHRVKCDGNLTRTRTMTNSY